VKLADPIRRSNYGATLLALFAVVPLAFAQNTAPTAAATAKPLAFDVVSLRPSQPDPSAGNVMWGITPDGYRVPNQPLIATLLMAYYPQGTAYWSGRIQTRPAWLSDHYDIDAKVSEADRAAWQKQGGMLDQEPMLREMLQTMLAERCKLVVHRVPGEIIGFYLDLGKHDPHLTRTKPEEALPTGVKFPDGGVRVEYRRGEELHQNFYNATMADLTGFLSVRSAGHPVEDHTGLTGHYDFVLNWVDDPDSKLPPGATDWDDPNSVLHWDVQPLGLHLTSAKIPIDNLVIDHIEKPSEN
jgi:uncharacterized protein (TIGR03435 family)